MVDVCNNIPDPSPPVFGQKAFIKADAYVTLMLAKSEYLIVTKVAGMLAQGLGGGVRSDNRSRTILKHVVKGLFGSMRDIRQDTHSRHGFDQLFPKRTQSVVLGIIFVGGGIAYVVVSVVAKGDVTHARLVKFLEQVQIGPQSVGVFDGQQDGFFTLGLEFPDIFGSSGESG